MLFGLWFMMDVGLFYEFLLMSEFDESCFGELGMCVVLLEGV